MTKIIQWPLEGPPSARRGLRPVRRAVVKTLPPQPGVPHGHVGGVGAMLWAVEGIAGGIAATSLAQGPRATGLATDRASDHHPQPGVLSQEAHHGHAVKPAMAPRRATFQIQCFDAVIQAF